jgi:hypothetical protein
MLLSVAIGKPRTVAAQNDLKIPDNVFKVTPLSMMDFTGLGIQVGYERRLGSNTSVTGELAIPTLASAYNLLSREESDVRLTNDIKVRAELRCYFARESKKSIWFLSMEGGYRFQSMMQEPGYYKKLENHRAYEVLYSSAHVTKSVYSVGYTIGNRTTLFETLYLEFQVGIGYRMFFTTHGDVQNAHEVERDRYLFEGRGSAAFTDGAMSRVYMPMALKLGVDMTNLKKKRSS